MRSSEIRLQKIEGQMRRNHPPMSEEEMTARIDEILAKVGLSYKGLLEKYGSTGGILRAIAIHCPSFGKPRPLDQGRATDQSAGPRKSDGESDG